MGDGEGTGNSRCTIEVNETYMEGTTVMVTVTSAVTLAHKIRMIGEGVLEGFSKDGKEPNCRYKKIKGLQSVYTFTPAAGQQSNVTFWALCGSFRKKKMLAAAPKTTSYLSPTKDPTASPTVDPQRSKSPTASPTMPPSFPTLSPSRSPSNSPTYRPTEPPSRTPTMFPTSPTTGSPTNNSDDGGVGNAPTLPLALLLASLCFYFYVHTCQKNTARVI